MTPDEIQAEARRRLNETCANRHAVEYEDDASRLDYAEMEALCRLIEEREAFKQEVSNFVDGWRDTADVLGMFTPEAIAEFDRFIIPKPKPDPLVEAIREASVSDADQGDADRLRVALAARGLKIVEVE